MYKSPALKKYLIEKFGEQCSECGQEGTWNNSPLVLQLDHIDGDSDNNFLKNLRLLCPNCHTQTENFGSKGQGSRYKKNTKRNLYLREYKGR
jgi:5-methylcytosine-specific restriction endonuclease McrA